MAEKKFIPVKVTDREWAEKLLDGEVFMRPLYEFGAWNLKKEDKQLNNSFRGDLCEGMSGIFGEVEECPIYDSFDENVKKYIKRIWYIDDGSLHDNYTSVREGQQGCLRLSAPRDKLSRSSENRGAAYATPRQDQSSTNAESFFSRSDSGPHRAA